MEGVRPQICNSTTLLSNELNHFFARFEAHNYMPAQKAPPPPDDPDSVKRTFSRFNAHKGSGPDNTPGRMLGDCAGERTDVFIDIFNISLSKAVVPTCLKATAIIPVQKKSSPSCLNDYHPVALTHPCEVLRMASHETHQSTMIMDQELESLKQTKS